VQHDGAYGFNGTHADYRGSELMNDVKTWATVICLVTLISALMQYLVPDGSMGKMMKLVLGVFVICGIVMPLSKIVPQISVNLQNATSSVQGTQTFKNTVDQQIYSAANMGIKNIVITELNTMNIKCENVEVMMDTKTTSSISISKVVVTVANSYAGRCMEIAAHLEKVLGLKTEVIVHDGSN
jgi:hypothetical protein